MKTLKITNVTHDGPLYKFFAERFDGDKLKSSQEVEIDLQVGQEFYTQVRQMADEDIAVYVGEDLIGNGLSHDVTLKDTVIVNQADDTEIVEGKLKKVVRRIKGAKK